MTIPPRPARPRPSQLSLTVATQPADGSYPVSGAGGDRRWALVRLPIDAFPDTVPVQVQVNTVASSLNPLEIEDHAAHRTGDQRTAGLDQRAFDLEVRAVARWRPSPMARPSRLARQLVSERLLGIELPEWHRAAQARPISHRVGRGVSPHRPFRNISIRSCSCASCTTG